MTSENEHRFMQYTYRLVYFARKYLDVLEDNARWRTASCMAAAILVVSTCIKVSNSLAYLAE